MIYIIADDLTGANDTGVQFAKKGYKTTVFMVEDTSSDIVFGDGYDVYVIDTETRELEEKMARERLNKILERIVISKGDIVYKKIDSTLRGNIGAEIEEIMKMLKKQTCIMSPSFPAHQRITIDGHLLVQKKPVGISAYLNHAPDKKGDSFIPSLLKKQTKLSIERINLMEVYKGEQAISKKLGDMMKEENKIIVIDSTNEEHLKDIVISGMKLGDKVLFSGSAGLANHLAGSYKKKKNSKIELKDNEDPILIVGGSQNPIMVDQIKYLKSHLKFLELKIDIEKMTSQDSKIIDDYVRESISILKNNQDLIIYTDAMDNEKKAINLKLMQKYHLNYKELENKIKESFGKLTALIVKESNIRNIVLTGGDIAISVCKELAILNLEVVGELLPGIPLTRACFNNNKLSIITKAGGFGTKDTLNKLVNKLRSKDAFLRVRG